MDIIQKQLAQIISKETEINEEKILSSFEWAPRKEYGDLSIHAMALMKEKSNPIEYSSNLKEKLNTSLPESIEKIDTAGPYINFFINKDCLAKITLKEITQKKENYAKLVDGKKVMIEYSSPNTNKPLHIGHLRNDSLGMSLSNLYSHLGKEVIKTIIINNRGIHISKSMLAYQKFGNGKDPHELGIKPDHFVGQMYVLFHEKLKEHPELEAQSQEMLVKWEEGNKEVRELWEKMNAWTLEGIKQTYKEFGSEFDIWTFESDIYNKAQSIIEEGLEKKVFFKNEDNAIIANLKSEGIANKTVLRSDGTSIYATQDLALTKKRFTENDLEKCIWIVGDEQNLYFQQIFAIFKLLGYNFWEKCTHLGYGLILLTSGKLKSREGKVVDADELIKELTSKALEKVKEKNTEMPDEEAKEISRKIALAAIKFWMLKVEKHKTVVFNPEETISFQGETGPYLLYTAVRMKRVLKKAGDFEYNFSDLTEESELIKHLYKFEKIVKESAFLMNPATLCTYLTELASKYNNFYQSKPILNSKEFKDSRLTLTQASLQVLEIGLYLLNIEIPEKM